MTSASAGLGVTGLMNAALGLRADFFFPGLVVVAFFVLFAFFAIWPPRTRARQRAGLGRMVARQPSTGHAHGTRRTLGTAMSEPLFQIRDLAKVYRMGEVEVHALRQVTLSLDEGQFVVLLG